MNTKIYSLKDIPNEIHIKDLRSLFNKEKYIEIIYPSPILYRDTETINLKIRKDFKFIIFDYDFDKDSFLINHNRFEVTLDNFVYENFELLIKDFYNSLIDANTKRKESIEKFKNNIEENTDDIDYIQTLERFIKANQADVENNLNLSSKILQYYSEYII